jgi:hypothetical protein
MGVAVGGMGVAVGGMGVAVGGIGVSVTVGSIVAPPHPVSNNTVSIKPSACCNSLLLLFSMLLEIKSACFIWTSPSLV